MGYKRRGFTRWNQSAINCHQIAIASMTRNDEDGIHFIINALTQKPSTCGRLLDLETNVNNIYPSYVSAIDPVPSVGIDRLSHVIHHFLGHCSNVIYSSAIFTLLWTESINGVFLLRLFPLQKKTKLIFTSSTLGGTIRISQISSGGQLSASAATPLSCRRQLDLLYRTSTS